MRYLESPASFGIGHPESGQNPIENPHAFLYGPPMREAGRCCFFLVKSTLHPAEGDNAWEGGGAWAPKGSHAMPKFFRIPTARKSTGARPSGMGAGALSSGSFRPIWGLRRHGSPFIATRSGFHAVFDVPISGDPDTVAASGCSGGFWAIKRASQGPKGGVRGAVRLSRTRQWVD